MSFNYSHIRTMALAIGLTGLAAYTTVLLRGPQGIGALENKHEQIRMLEEENANLQRDLDAKREHIVRLQNDPATQELELRRRTKLQRPGETKFVLPDAQAHASIPAR